MGPLALAGLIKPAMNLVSKLGHKMTGGGDNDKKADGEAGSMASRNPIKNMMSGGMMGGIMGGGEGPGGALSAIREKAKSFMGM
jgi:hypothetical protein